MKGRKSVCITGTAHGLGRALATEYLNRGDFLVLAVSRDPSRAEPAFPASDNLRPIAADITTPAGRQTVADAVADVGGLDILIHNAGKLVFRPYAEITGEQLRSVYEVNVFAPFLLTQKLLPHFGKCHVISISSVGGVEGSLKFAGLSAYSSSKAALNCLTEMWSEEFKETDHSFNCLAMGSVETQMFREAFPEVAAAATSEVMASYIADFSVRAPSVMRGKIISLSRSNP